MERRLLAQRFLLPPAVIVAVFFFFEKSRPFAEVWKPIALYLAIAVPLFFVIDHLRTRRR